MSAPTESSGYTRPRRRGFTRAGVRSSNHSSAWGDPSSQRVRSPLNKRLGLPPSSPGSDPLAGILPSTTSTVGSHVETDGSRSALSDGSHIVRSCVPPLPPSSDPPYLAPEPLEEEEEYEYPLVDCSCIQVYWSPFFTKFCADNLNLDLKHRSKKGTPAHGKMRPAKEGRFFRAIRRVGERANKKGKKLKREWTQRQTTWNYQDAHFQELELELERLRRQLSQQSNQAPPPSITRQSSEPSGPSGKRVLSQASLPSSMYGDNNISRIPGRQGFNANRRFTLT